MALMRGVREEGVGQKTVTVSKKWDVVHVKNMMQLKERQVPERHRHRT
jgi:hypothetical protein